MLSFRSSLPARLTSLVLSVSLVFPNLLMPVGSLLSFWNPGPQETDNGNRTSGPALPNLPNIEDVKQGRFEHERMSITPLPSKPATKCRPKDTRCQTLIEKKKIGSLLPSERENRADEMIASRSEMTGKYAKAEADWREQYLPASLRLSDSMNASLTDAVIRSAPMSAKTVAAIPAPPPPAWPASDYDARLDRRNRVGGVGEDLLSGNYHWSLPLLGLPGRAGLNLGLALQYNSKIWLRVGNEMSFDPDFSWPTPGFRLGFPVLEGSYWIAGQNRYLLVLPNGHRVELIPNGTNTWESFDGSFIQAKYNDPSSGWMTVRMTDGTSLKYKLTDPIAPNQCKEIRDRYGNYLTITYNDLWVISTVKDTLGRIVTFDYGTDPNLNYGMPLRLTQTWNGQTHEWATFYYGTRVINANFPGLTNAYQNYETPVLTGVKLADNSYYTFEYTSYAQVRAIRYRPVGATCDRAGTIYNLPNAPVPPDTGAPPAEPGCFAPEAADLGTNTAQSDGPVFTKRTDYAVWWGKFATEFVTGPATTWASGQIKTPDGTYYREWFHDSSQGQKAYLTRQSEYYDTVPPAGDNGPALKKNTVVWETPSTTGRGNPRPQSVDISDNSGNLRRTTYTYTTYNLPTFVFEYGGQMTNPPLLRKTETQYNLTSAYTNRRIIGLPEQVKLWDGSTLMSSVQYVYDDYNTVPLAQFQVNSSWQTEQFSAPSGTTALGNVTQTRRYDVTNLSSYVETKTGYYPTGSVASVTDPMGKTRTISYDDSFLGSVGGTANKAKRAYPTKYTDPDSFFSTAQYEFDTGFVKRTVDPKQVAVVRTYDSTGRVQRIENEVNGSFTDFSYAADNAFVSTSSTLLDAAISNAGQRYFSLSLFDGIGRSVATLSDHPGSTLGYKLQYTFRDNLHRPASVSNLVEVNAWWQNDDPNTTGEDDAAGISWTTQTYDWNGRPRVFTNQDGTTKEISYGGCGCAGGDVITIQSEPLPVNRRTQKLWKDPLGRTVKNQIMEWDGITPYSTTLTEYNVRNQVTAVKVFKDDAAIGSYCPEGTCQQTEMVYDGHGRLQKRYQPEYQNPGVNPPFATNSAAKFMNWQYYADDRVFVVTDPRQASATYTYNNRGLVSGISYYSPAGVAATSNVSFLYNEVGQRTLMDDGPGSVTYGYDTLGRLQSESRLFDLSGAPAGPFTINYLYELNGKVKKVTDPFGDEINYTYDKSGRPLTVTGTTAFAGVTSYLTSPSYRAWDAVKALGSTTYSYDNRLRLTTYNSSIFNVSYQYNNAGQLTYAQQLSGEPYHQGFSYDQVGRLTGVGTPEIPVPQEYVGTVFSPPNGLPPGLKLRPFTTNITYDEFGNMTDRSSSYWFDVTGSLSVPPQNFQTTYVNNRAKKDGVAGRVVNQVQQTWTYDAMGQIVNDQRDSQTYDAVGRLTKTQNLSDSIVNFNYTYDGDGRQVKIDHVLNSSTTDKRYRIYSTVLGGLLTDVNASGQKKETWVYTLVGQPARQVKAYTVSIPGTGDVSYPDQVVFESSDPHGTRVNRWDGQPNTYRPIHISPAGVNTEAIQWGVVKDRFVGTISGYYSYAQNAYAMYQSTANGVENPANPGTGCTLDGQKMSCSSVLRALRRGTAEVQDLNSPGGVIQGPGYHAVRGRDEEGNDEWGGVDVGEPPNDPSNSPGNNTPQQGQPCDVVLPTDQTQLDLVYLLAHELTPADRIGMRQYQNGDRVGNRTGQRMTEEVLSQEAFAMASAVRNYASANSKSVYDALHDSTYIQDGISKSAEGILHIGRDLVNQALQTENGDKPCERLRRSVAAATYDGENHSSGVRGSILPAGYMWWKAVPRATRVRQQNFRGVMDIRFGDTDFTTYWGGPPKT